MGNCSRRNEDGGSVWELDEKFELPENNVCSSTVVKAAERSNSAPPIRTVEDVAMLESPDIAAEVECGAGEDRPREVGLKVRQFAVQRLKMFFVM